MSTNYYEEGVQAELKKRDSDFNFGFMVNLKRLSGDSKFKPLLLPEQLNDSGISAFSDDELGVITDTIVSELNNDSSNALLISKDMIEYSENVFVNEFGKFSTNLRFVTLKKLTSEIFKSSTILIDRFRNQFQNSGFTEAELEELIAIVRLNRFTQDY